MRGPSPTPGSSTQDSGTEESAQNLSLKTSGDLDHLGEPKAAENPDVLLKSQYRDSPLACRHSTWALMERQHLRGH